MSTLAALRAMRAEYERYACDACDLADLALREAHSLQLFVAHIEGLGIWLATGGDALEAAQRAWKAAGREGTLRISQCCSVTHVGQADAPILYAVT